jgi:hypothetical protein
MKLRQFLFSPVRSGIGPTEVLGRIRYGRGSQRNESNLLDPTTLHNDIEIDFLKSRSPYTELVSGQS